MYGASKLLVSATNGVDIFLDNFQQQRKNFHHSIIIHAVSGFNVIENGATILQYKPIKISSFVLKGD